MTADWLRALVTAIQFLTRIPLPGGATPASFASDAPRMLALLPLTGAGIGATSAGCLWLAGHLWPFPLAVLVTLAIEALLTGALHEDAVADSCDAFGGATTSADTLRILKDSRIGTYGVLGLGFALALRTEALIFIAQPTRAALALITSGLLGRLAILCVMALAPPVADRPGLASAVGGPPTRGTLLRGTGFVLPMLLLSAWADPRALGLGIILGVPFLLWFSRLVRRRIGGSNGDCLGCAAYVSMVLVTLAYAARL